jgi:hypothetical protein
MRRLSDAQLELLAFIAGLTVAPKSCLEARYGAGVSYDLKKLKAMGLAGHRSFTGRASVWQLTTKGCSTVGVSESRARRLGGQALHHHVVVSHLVTRLGYRLLDREKAKELLTDAPPSVSYVIGSKGQDTVLFRVLTPGPFTDPRAITRSIKQLETKRDRSLFNSDEYGYLITAENRHRKKAITHALKASKLYGQGFALRVEVYNANSAEATD